MIGVLAINEAGVIGDRGKLLYRLPDDMLRFRSLTSGKTVLMGRKTAESIGSPLRGRTNVVVSGKWFAEMSRGYSIALSRGWLVVPDVDTFLRVFPDHSDVAFIGGASLMNAVKHLVTTWHVTEVNDAADGDTRIPKDFFLWMERTVVRERNVGGSPTCTYCEYRWPTF